MTECYKPLFIYYVQKVYSVIYIQTLFQLSLMISLQVKTIIWLFRQTENGEIKWYSHSYIVVDNGDRTSLIKMCIWEHNVWAYSPCYIWITCDINLLYLNPNGWK